MHAAKLLAIVDDLRDETDLKGLDTENNYGVTANVTSVILIGGELNIKINTIIYFGKFRTEFRRKAPRRQIHHRILRGLYKRRSVKHGQIRVRLAPDFSVDRHQARKCPGRMQE